MSGKAPRTAMRKGFAILSGILVMGLIAAGSRVPWRATEPGSALVRLSWRTPALLLQDCETLSPSQNAELPEHMRGAQHCEGEGVPWALDILLDDDPLVRDTIAPAGIRGDRPVYVLRNLAVRPGEHTLRVTFRPLLPDGPVADSLALRALALDETIRLGDGEVLLVTVDGERRALVVRRPLGPE